MAHFGVQKARRMLGLAGIAAVAGVGISSTPASAVSGTIGDISYELDGTMPALVKTDGKINEYNSEYNGPEERSARHLLVDNEHFSCSRHDSSLDVLLKDATAFKTFTESKQNADNMMEVCGIVTAAEYAGNVSDTSSSVSISVDSSVHNYLISNGSGAEFMVDLDLDYDADGDGAIDYTFASENTRIVAILGQPINNNGKIRLRMRPGLAGRTTISYGNNKDFDITVVDFTLKTGNGDVYFYDANRYKLAGNASSSHYDLARVHYIGTEDINFPDLDASSEYTIMFGAHRNQAVAETKSLDPVGVNVSVKTKSLDAKDIEVVEGSDVSFETELKAAKVIEAGLDVANITVRDESKITFEAGTTQTGEKRLDIHSSDSEVVFNGGNYGDIQIDATKSNVTINDGNFVEKSVARTAETDSLIKAYTTDVVINGGTFEQQVKALDADAAEPDAIWHNDTHALFHLYNYNADTPSTLTINGGSFKSNGSILSAESDASADSRITVNDGNFESKHLMALANRWNGTATLNDGTYNTYDRFFVWDVLNDWECGKVPFDDVGLGAVARLCSEGGEVRGWGTGVQGQQRNLVQPNPTQIVIKGGDYSDGYNKEDGSGVFPASGYAEVELDTDYDNDGRKDVRVLPEEVISTSVGLYEEKGLNVPEGFELVGEPSNDSCSARIENGKVIIKGLKVTGGDSANFCRVSVSDKESKVHTYSVSVIDNNDYKDGNPISVSEGDSVTPDDTTKNPEDYDWQVVDGGEYCSVSDSGVITAIKGGGKCTVVARDPETNEDGKHEVITWEITTTSPIEMEVGESKKPGDLPDGAENGEWSSDNTDVCTVAADGTITAKKAGTCHVTLTLEDGSVYTWTVNIKENPNTLDKKQAMTFSIAGAAIAGLGAMIATAKRFIRR